MSGYGGRGRVLRLLCVLVGWLSAMETRDGIGVVL